MRTIIFLVLIDGAFSSLRESFKAGNRPTNPSGCSSCGGIPSRCFLSRLARNKPNSLQIGRGEHALGTGCPSNLHRQPGTSTLGVENRFSLSSAMSLSYHRLTGSNGTCAHRKFAKTAADLSTSPSLCSGSAQDDSSAVDDKTRRVTTTALISRQTQMTTVFRS